MVFAHVDHDDLLVDIELRGSQADPRGCVHGFGHVIDQLSGFGIDFLHAPGGLVQPRVGVLQDLQNGHKCLLKELIMCRIYRDT